MPSSPDDGAYSPEVLALGDRVGEIVRDVLFVAPD
jgi:hypothetical protein